MAAYARQAKDSALIRMATEIKVRAERCCGELLSQSELRNGGHAMKARSNDATEVPPTLAEMGLSKSESSRYQQLAAMPAEHFETAVATARLTRDKGKSAQATRPAGVRLAGLAHDQGGGQVLRAFSMASAIR